MTTPKTKQIKLLYRSMIITVVCLAAVSAAAFGAWRVLVKDQALGCHFDLGVISFDLPDIGQRMYCPDQPGHRPAGKPPASA